MRTPLQKTTLCLSLTLCFACVDENFEEMQSDQASQVYDNDLLEFSDTSEDLDGELEPIPMDIPASSESTEEFDIGTAEPKTMSSCINFGCDGKDPMDTGCGNDAITVDSMSQGWFGGKRKLEVRYSPYCETRWTRWSGPQSSSTVKITRYSFMGEPTETLTWGPYNGSLNYTDMFYCPKNECWTNSESHTSSEDWYLSWIKTW